MWRASTRQVSGEEAGAKNDSLLDYALWLFNIAMENGPFIDDLLIKSSMYSGFSMAMLNNQMESV